MGASLEQLLVDRDLLDLHDISVFFVFNDDVFFLPLDDDLDDLDDEPDACNHDNDTPNLLQHVTCTVTLPYLVLLHRTSASLRASRRLLGRR